MPESTDAGVAVAGLRKRWGATVAVDDVSFEIAAGEVVALLGPNGAGKSTTIDMILGLLRPDAGTVRLWGQAPQRACAAGQVGALLQAGGLLGAATVAELVEVMRRLSPHPMARADVLATARIADIAGARADRLSGGQAQRVRFALAIAGDPQLLVLDEPTVAMDVTARRGFWAAMREWTERGRTVLFATHYLEEADAYADRVILMARGRVVADGPTSEVKAAVGGRTIRARIAAAEHDRLAGLPGVAGVDRRGDLVTLHCPDSDRALRALLGAFPSARDIEVVSMGLEDAFVALTDPQEEVLA